MPLTGQKETETDSEKTIYNYNFMSNILRAGANIMFESRRLGAGLVFSKSGRFRLSLT
jgi:hypothetical protein